MSDGHEKSDVRDRIERGFAAWGHLAYRRAGWVIALALLGTAALASQLPKLWIETSTESFFHESDPARVTYDRFRAQFGQDVMIVVAIKPPRVFDLEFLEKLRALHEDVEDNVPRLVEVTSLINARQTRGEEDELIVGDFLEDWPRTPEELAELERRAMANPFYANNIVSEQGDFTALVIETEAYSTVGVVEDEFGGFDGEEPGATDQEPAFITGAENAEIMEALNVVLDRHRAPDFELWSSGAPVLTHELQMNMQRDMKRFTSLALAMIALFLSLLFRRASGVVLPIVTVLLSVICTMSLMAMSGTPLTTPTQILPSFLLAVGVGGSVHILAIFYQALRRGETREQAIAFAMGHSGLAVFMTGLTTAGGLLSFMAAELAPIAHFGVFGPVGVMVAQVFTLTLLPALIAVFPLRARPRAAQDTFVSQRGMVRLGDFCVRHASAVAGVWGVLLLVALAGALQLRFTHHPFEWFAEDSEPRVASELMNEEMGGSLFLEFLIDTGEENGLHDPALLQRLDAIADLASQARVQEANVGKTTSLVDVVKEIHQALNENRREFYLVPEDRQLVSQELLLFENSGSDDLEDLVDSEFRTARVTMKLPFVDSVYLPPLYDALQEGIAEILDGTAEHEITGMGLLMGETILAVMHTMARSYVMAFLIITPLMVLLIGRLKLGLVAMIPNLAPILITLGAMGWLGVGIDTFTLLIGCIAIGLAVDDTIHFMHNFRRYFEQTADVREAVRRTLASTGQAMLVTSCVLSAGFFIYMGSNMPTLFRFGLLTGSTIILAFLADVIFAPALMALVARPQEEGATAAATPMEVTR
ncbi:MAG: efflux RND transporter permease subunit [Myxococcota bacterium]